MQEYNSLVQQQRQFFATGATLSYSFRMEQLTKLATILRDHEAQILAALQKDLRKANLEGYASEMALVTKEIRFAINHLKRWMHPKSVGSPFPIFFPGQSKIYPDPYGIALIIAPWNYPFQLSLSPLVGAISAGNCVILKPSELAPHTEDIIFQLISQHFPKEYISVCKCDAEQTKTLLQEKFDYIFFTGSKSIATEIMAAAAKHLTPVTLELGGKSPCIVDNSANLDYAARRIMWGKFINAGQTCISPDYLYIQEDCKDKFIEKCIRILKQFYGDDPNNSASYGRIINERHFSRLVRLMEQGHQLTGGKIDKDQLYIAPTIIDQVSWDDPIMQQEIFGPLLPILTFKHINEVVTNLNKQPKPLALYLFTNNKQHEKEILKRVSFGNGCVNDCVLQIVNPHLPFGGVGESGMGQYHGKYSFETFSHKKSVYTRLLPIDLRLEYPPFTDEHLHWIKQIFKI